MGLQSGNVGNRICCGDKDAADTGRPKSCRGVPAGQCAGAAAGTPLQHHTSVPHRETCYFSATFVTTRDIFFIDVCVCWRDIPAGEQVRQTAAGPVQFHQTFAASLTIDQIQPVMKAEVDVGDGCWWILPSVRARRCLRQHAGRRIRCILRAARSGMARLCPRATSLSPPRRLCPLPD